MDKAIKNLAKKDLPGKNLLGVDFGQKHTGIAISLNGVIPLGLTTISGDSALVIDKIKEIVVKNSIEVVVVGVLDSKVHGDSQKEELEQFIEKLGDEFVAEIKREIRIETVDEMMTSKAAQRYAGKGKEHQEAARIILEDWMWRNNYLKS